MADISYIKDKLSDLSKRGIEETGVSLLELRDLFIESGASNGSAARHHVAKTFKEDYERALQKMATLLIDVGENENSQALNEFKDTAGLLCEDLLEQHKILLFGNPAFMKDVEAQTREGKARIRSELSQITDLILEDTRNGIVGYSKHEPAPPEPSVNVEARGSNVVVGSPNANVQQGRDNLSQKVTDWDPSTLIAILSEVTDREREIELCIEDSEALMLQVAALEAQATSKSRDPGIISQGINYIARTLLTAADGRFQSIVNRLFELQQPLS